MAIRKARMEDIPQVRKLWQSGFPDPDAFMDYYFDKQFSPDEMVVEDRDGVICSIASVYDNAALMVDGQDLGKCPCLFAVTTDEAYRGSGYGMKLLQSLIDEKEETHDITMITPADESLAELYGRLFDYKDRFYVLPILFQPLHFFAQPDAKKAKLVQIGTERYGELREAYLADVSHLKFTDKQLDMERYICESSGCGLYEIETEAGNGICAAERLGESHVRVNELLLAEEGIGDFMRALEDTCKAQTYLVRMLPQSDQEKIDKGLESYAGVYTITGVKACAKIRTDRKFEDQNPWYAGFVFD